LPLPPAVTPRISRRRWLKRAGWGTGAALLGFTVDAVGLEPHWLEMVERDLPVAGLPTMWQGMTLVQISDLHIGHSVSDSFLLKSFARVADATPDLVVITGDFLTLDFDGQAPFSQVEDVCRQLPHGRLETLAILGNHDYGRHWSEPAVAEELVGILGGCGVRVLRNQTADVGGLQVVGLDDLWAGRCDVARGLASSMNSAPRIVLCHNPDAADRAGWGDYQGWILAGHTHGGQCKPPFLPAPIVPVKNRRYVAGEVDLFDGRRLYINRALGHTYRIRFNVRPEITLFRLTAA